MTHLSKIVKSWLSHGFILDDSLGANADQQQRRASRAVGRFHARNPVMMYLGRFNPAHRMSAAAEFFNDGFDMDSKDSGDEELIRVA